MKFLFISLDNLKFVDQSLFYFKYSFRRPLEFCRTTPPPPILAPVARLQSQGVRLEPFTQAIRCSQQSLYTSVPALEIRPRPLPTTFQVPYCPVTPAIVSTKLLAPDRVPK
jgi:hypothetical protein